MKETYREMKARHARELAALPIFWAFGQAAIDATLTEMSCTIGEVCSIWHAGDIVRRSDAAEILADHRRRARELHEAMKDHDFLVGALLEEMRDCKAMADGYQPVLHRFDMDTWEDLANRSQHFRQAWDEAQERYEDECLIIF